MFLWCRGRPGRQGLKNLGCYGKACTVSGNPALSSAGCLAPVLTELFSVWQTYLTVGGLPEAAAAFLSARDIAAADHVLAQYL